MDAAILGEVYRALGSTIVDQLARAGHTEITLWDMDCLEAHNSARHVCTHSIHQTSNFITKSELVSQHLKKLSHDHGEGVVVQNQYFELEGNESFCRSALHLLDTTGSDLDRYWHNFVECPVSRLYISDEGRIGLIQTQPKGGVPDMLDLDATVYLSASNHVEVQQWLSRQSSLNVTLVGLSCSSDTLKMPWSSVLNHASSLVPVLKQQFQRGEPLLGLNVLDDHGVPKGYKELAAPEVLAFDSYTVTDNNEVSWKVTVSEAVLNKMRDVAKKYAPKEAGGYLLGLFSMESHRISLVFASEGRFRSTGSTLELEPIETDAEVGLVLKDSCNMLVPLGTWHSHPNSSSKESSRDMSTYKKAISNPEQSLPFVMMIQGDDGHNVLVGLNRGLSN